MPPTPTRGPRWTTSPTPHDHRSVRLSSRLPWNAAVAAAWQTFTTNEALALFYKHRDGLPQKTIAALLGVGEPRVSRLLSRGIERLVDAVTPLKGVTGETLSFHF